MQQHIHTRSRHGGPTKLLVHPLGIDFEFWTELRDSCKEEEMDPRLVKIGNSKFVLSVDRVDYTKAVLDRLLIVDRFFETHPEQIGQVTFVQVCGRSRPGLPAFDQYWHACRSLLGAVNNRWKVGDWKPVDWIEHSLSPKDLSYLYSKADCMLVNPVRDGLNLTAKEFIACQGSDPGVLLLSPGAGAIHELGDYALPAAPGDRDGTVASIAQSLVMPLKERQHRALKMKTILVSNQLSHWWTAFSQVTRVPDMHLVAREEEEEELMRNLG
jgi:trehalose-6-phosphate synthase